MLCYTGPFPDKRELTLVNLADKTSTRTCIDLEDMKFMGFVNHRNWSDMIRICFLAERSETSADGTKTRDKLYHCIFNCEKMF